MPYKSIGEAKKGSFPTKAEGISLTLSQINKLASIYDAIKKNKIIKNPFAVAWVTWKKVYEKKKDKWVLRAKGKSEKDSASPDKSGYAVTRENMMQFKKYKSKKNEDGTYNIFEVPIFEIGKHKGFEYTEDWAEKTIANLYDEAQGDYLPPVIIGHNDGKEEKQAKGFIKHLKLYGKMLVADLVKIPEIAFNWLKEGAYPYRSVEVIPKENKITALALLGGTTPYHKLPILEVYQNLFHDDKDHEIIEFEFTFENKSLLEEIKNKIVNLFDRQTKIENEINKIKTSNISGNEEGNMAGKQFTEDDLALAIKTAKDTASQEFKEEFKKKHGLYPLELIEQQKTQAEEARVAGITSFCETLKAKRFDIENESHALAPAIIDEIVLPFMTGAESGTIKFAEKEVNIMDATKQLVEKIIEYAVEEKLFVNMTEQIEHDETKEVKTRFDNQDDVNKEALAIHKKVLKVQKAKSISYEEALAEIINV